MNNENSVYKYYSIICEYSNKHYESINMMNQSDLLYKSLKRDEYLDEFLNILSSYKNACQSRYSTSLIEIIDIYKYIYINLISNIFIDNNIKSEFLNLFFKSKEDRLFRLNNLFLNVRTLMNFNEFITLSWNYYNIHPEELIYEYDNIIIKLINKNYDIRFILESIKECKSEE